MLKSPFFLLFGSNSGSPLPKQKKRTLEQKQDQEQDFHDERVQVIPLADYYIIAGVIYQAPDLGSVINSRVLTAVHGIQSAFDEAMSYCRYHPSKGYWWHFKDHEEQDKVKPKAKRKEEPSSIFQRQRVDALLLDLRQKFPPKFVQQKSGEKPVPVDQTKKEAEPIPETVKSEEKETTKNVQQIVSTKGPPEKRMRLQ
ncbi:mediator of RNA polymerase II transcription subunit 6 isoform X3 [Ailuropoda melanoleuca]|uniref:Mediator of RNA polymerase II transcription subunit 6 n=2 Tax=Ailuropoda melanoleuca TaxID=9646 RepID=A0A7N5JSA2_AILME|nr:mediator of RNA polymerase II transcription subunit 6 isoform X3 [Ailuropoda melanoleuca]